MPLRTGDSTQAVQLGLQQAALIAAKNKFGDERAQKALNFDGSDPEAEDLLREIASGNASDALRDGYLTQEEYNGALEYGRSTAEQVIDPTAAKVAGIASAHVTSPGVSIDPAAYATTTAQQNANAWNVDRMQQIDARDPNRFYADRASIDDVAAQNAQFQAPGTISTVAQGRNYFDATGQALTDADAALAQAQSYNIGNGGKSADQYDASTQLRLAALGTAPSAAEAMARQSGNEQQRAYSQQQLDANAATRRGSNDIRSSQLSQAAAARGNVSGLAGLRAANNTALGQAQLYQASRDDTARRAIESNAARTATDNQAGLVRAQEMATARGQYADNSAAVRGQNLDQSGQLGSLAQQQAALAGQQYSVDQAVLQNAQNNAQLTNQGNQFASQGNYTAAAANADRQLAAGQANQAADWNVQQANQNAAVQAQNLDDTAYGNVNTAVMDAANNEQAAKIKLEQDYQGALQQNSALENNYQTGNATLVQQAAQFEKERGDKIVGSAIGAGAAVLGAVASDERLKKIKGHADPYDFSNAEDDVYSYKSEHQGKFPGADDREHTGPMAQDLPDDVQYDVNGKRVVDTGRLAMRLASSLGAAQRDIKQLKQARG